MVIFFLLMIACIVGADVLFLSKHFVARLTVNIAIVVVFGVIWRDNGVDSYVTVLVPGTAIDIPVGTAFQYRNLADTELKFICVAMPPWPGASEASYVAGIWRPTV